VALARATTSEVLPTPGDPSRRMGLLSCIARTTRNAFDADCHAMRSVGVDKCGCGQVGVDDACGHALVFRQMPGVARERVCVWEVGACRGQMGIHALRGCRQRSLCGQQTALCGLPRTVGARRVKSPPPPRGIGPRGTMNGPMPHETSWSTTSPRESDTRAASASAVGRDDSS
jgi:hypothetical protein